MIVTFCGHSKIYEDLENLKTNIIEILRQEIGSLPVNFYLGCDGDFDYLSYISCVEYKKYNNNVKISFVTPYINETYLKNKLINKKNYDEIIYPELEKIPKKIAIIKRNFWMVEKSNLVLAYVEHSWGGANRTLNYAKKLKKKYVNIARIIN